MLVFSKLGQQLTEFDISFIKTKHSVSQPITFVKGVNA
jgi:hypothetical protein